METKLAQLRAIHAARSFGQCTEVWCQSCGLDAVYRHENRDHEPLYVGCQQPTLGGGLLAGSEVTCETHVRAYYRLRRQSWSAARYLPTIAECEEWERTEGGPAFGNGEDEGDDVQANWAAWAPNPLVDLALLAAYRQSSAGR